MTASKILTPGWLLLAVLPVLVHSGCSEPPPAPEILRPVRTQQVFATGGTRVRSFSGRARAGQEIDLSFRVPGSIERLEVKVGDSVQAGQLIAQLERDDYQIAVRQAEADLSRAQANARNARADLERIRALWENDSASQGEMDAARAGFESAEAQAESAVQALRSARRRLGYTTLGAPVNGSIARVPVEVNENVQQGQPVVMMTAGSRPEVDVAIPGVLISEIRESQQVEVTLDALPGERLDAVVTEVGVASTGAATTFPVTVRLSRTDSRVRPGMAATVAFRFEDADGRERIHLPPHAVGEDRDGRFVFLLEPGDQPGEGRVVRKPVEVADTMTPDGLEILSGLSEGQQVVTAGVRRLTDGQRVRLLTNGNGQ